MKKFVSIIALALFFSGNAYAEQTYLVCGKKENTHIFYDELTGFEKYKVGKTYQKFDFDIIKKSELYIELFRNKELVTWKINRHTGEGTRKVGDLSWDYNCKKVEKKF
jgi:hypothetical protein